MCIIKIRTTFFSFFIEKAMKLGRVVSFIVPKSLINAPEFNLTREVMKAKRIERIIDFGEKGFKGVKIETISFIIDTNKKPKDTIVESYITESVKVHQQSYITDGTYPYWLIYRNEEFDEVAPKCISTFSRRIVTDSSQNPLRSQRGKYEF